MEGRADTVRCEEQETVADRGDLADFFKGLINLGQSLWNGSFSFRLKMHMSMLPHFLTKPEPFHHCWNIRGFTGPREQQGVDFQKYTEKGSSPWRSGLESSGCTWPRKGIHSSIVVPCCSRPEEPPNFLIEVFCLAFELRMIA